MSVTGTLKELENSTVTLKNTNGTIYMSRLVGKPTMWFLNKSDTNQAVQAGNFGFRKYRNCTIRVAKTKALISFAVTAKLICAFVFADADCWFSHAVAHILCRYIM